MLRFATSKVTNSLQPAASTDHQFSPLQAGPYVSFLTDLYNPGRAAEHYNHGSLDGQAGQFWTDSNEMLLKSFYG
jgi:hypothetical protein